ncbi:STAS domain-containing protein [Streptomyces sp. NPDC059740]|uniref:STAS domain-containing protein n=1 Tax=Streptomyces sp. NPDC059740 TaxID=3346926 RepID=UPI003649386C
MTVDKSPQARPSGDEDAAIGSHSTASAYVLAPTGELDADAEVELRESLDAAVAAGCGHVVLDLSRVTFADSTALQLVLAAHLRCDLRLAGPLAPEVRRLIDVTGMNAVLHLFPSVAEAAAR